MPCSYAHYKFGQEVLSGLTRDIRDAILPFKELYDIGLHGPDIFFYHNPILPDRVTRIGHGTHDLSGLEVFSGAARVVRAHGESGMYLAYAYGYLCHFALDCMCHGTVNSFCAQQGLSHNEIEMEFDRALTVADGLDPLRHDTAAHIVPSRRNAAVITAFYPGIQFRDTARSLKAMPFCLRTLLAPDLIKRRALLAAFRAAGKYKEMAGLVMSLEPNPLCRESSRRLTELYKLAVPLAIKLITEFRPTFQGKLEPDRHYGLNFLSEKVSDEVETQ